MSEPGSATTAHANAPTTLINTFTVPPEESDRFLHRWKDTARIMASQPGFIRARLHRSLTDDDQPRFVNVAEWDSGKALDEAAANPQFRASVQRLLDDPDLHATGHPVVYQVAIDVHPGDTP